jgi:O-antigen/teichoic acid export membrane protein
MTPISSQGFKRYFVNTSWLMGHRVLSMVVALFVGVELVKTPERRDELLGTAFWLKAGGAILMFAGIAAAVPFTHNDTQTNILIVIIAFAVIFQAFNVIDFNYQAEVKSKYVVYAQLVSLVISSITKLVFVWIAAPLVWFACVILLDAVVLAAGMTAMYLKNTGKIWYWKWRWQTAKELFRDSWPLILSGMVISIYMKIDQVMIKEMLDAEQVGLYAAAVKLSEAWYFVPVAITSSVFPAIINAKKQSEELYYQRLQKLYDLMVWLAVAIALPTTFLAPWVIRVLYGEAFLPAAGVLSIHIWAGVFVFLGVASGKWFITENFMKLSFYRTFFGAIGNVVFNLIFIPILHIKGAAMGTLLANFLAAYFFDVINLKTRKNFLMKTKSLCFFIGVKK